MLSEGGLAGDDAVGVQRRSRGEHEQPERKRCKRKEHGEPLAAHGLPPRSETCPNLALHGGKVNRVGQRVPDVACLRGESTFRGFLVGDDFALVFLLPLLVVFFSL